eukprot:GHVU01060431.1.p1 GENE.GHVU01060431.1~~GHVU01060431.1.p1  ORF type:complete len:107 (+),score=2.30 GHVU01060431.1:113-433(+)
MRQTGLVKIPCEERSTISGSAESSLPAAMVPPPISSGMSTTSSLPAPFSYETYTSRERSALSRWYIRLRSSFRGFRVFQPGGKSAMLVFCTVGLLLSSVVNSLYFK